MRPAAKPAQRRGAKMSLLLPMPLRHSSHSSCLLPSSQIPLTDAPRPTTKAATVLGLAATRQARTRYQAAPTMAPNMMTSTLLLPTKGFRPPLQLHRNQWRQRRKRLRTESSWTFTLPLVFRAPACD